MSIKPGQTKQFSTFDNLGDRRELVILFEKLGEGLPDQLARAVRAGFLESLIPLSYSQMRGSPMKANPAECSPTGAYQLFIAITGVLGVSIDDAARKLDDVVRRKAWMGDTFDRDRLFTNEPRTAGGIILG